MVKKRRSKAKYSYFIVRFDPLAADTRTQRQKARPLVHVKAFYLHSSW